MPVFNYARVQSFSGIEVGDFRTLHRSSATDRLSRLGVERTLVRKHRPARRITKAGNALARRVLIEGASDAGLVPMFFPDYKSVDDPQIRARYEDAWGTKLDPKKKGLTVVEIMDAVHHDVVKGR